MSDRNNFILQDVINDLVDTTKSLESALFKLYYFGRLIKNETLVQYSNAEINGYKELDPPNYRKAIAKLTIRMQVGYNEHTAELPISMLEEPFNTQLQYSEIREGIRVLERMSNSSNQEGASHLRTDLPMEMLAYIQPAATRLYKSHVRLVVTQGIITTNANVVIQIISTVRSRLLAFCMDIAEEFGYDIEITSFKTHEVINNQTINHIIKTQITNNGNGNINNTGNEAELYANISLKKEN